MRIFWIVISFTLLKFANFCVRNKRGRVALAIHWIHAMAFEMIALPLSFVLFPIGFLWKTKVSQGKRPILLVHGYTNSSIVWAYYRWMLPKLNIGPIYMLNLRGHFHPLSEYVTQVEKKAAQIERETGIFELILFGHSMGGVICSLYITKRAVCGKVTHLVTIASPLKGTVVALFGLGQNAREMRRGSSALRDLETDFNALEKTKVFHVLTQTDELVIPYTSGSLKGPKSRRLVIQDIGHISLLFSRRVFLKIAKWIQ